MKKEEVSGLIDKVKYAANELIEKWHECCMSQIRLNSANMRHLEKLKCELILEAKKKKR